MAMDILHGSAFASHFCLAHPLAGCSNSSSRPWRSAFICGGDVSLFFLRLSTPRPHAVSPSRRLRISSNLGRRPKRRNTLREKLLRGQEQVSNVVEVAALELQAENKRLGLGLDIVRESLESEASSRCANSLYENDFLFHQEAEKVLQADDGLGRREVGGKAVLWNKLETWVEQYKKDSEMWGVGSVPIFTIYEDSNGNVTRVSLNEVEIIKRTRNKAWSLHSKEFGDVSVDADAKISHARLLAKAIESGEYKLAKSSTIAKIVVEGSESALGSDRFPSLDVGGRKLLKLSPHLALGVLFGCSILWSLMKVLFIHEKTELTREEKEMLRRKIKSRSIRSTFENSRTEILKEMPEFPTESIQRPLLDKQELMMSIKAKVPAEESMISDLDSQFGDENFEGCVREIRKMVKQVREDRHVDMKANESDEFSLATSQDKLPGSSPDANLGTSSVNRLHSNTFDDSKLAIGRETVNFSMVMEKSNVRKPISSDEFMESEALSNNLSGKLEYMDDFPAVHINPEDGTKTMNMNISNVLKKGDYVSLSTLHNGEGMQVDQIYSNNISLVNNNSTKMKSKIIASLKEARDYLSHRRMSSKDISSLNQDKQEKLQPALSLVNGSLHTMNHTVCTINSSVSPKSSSPLVYEPKAPEQKKVDDPSCRGAATSLLSIETDTTKTGSESCTSVEDKTSQVRAIRSACQTLKKTAVAALKGTASSGNLSRPDHNVVANEKHLYRCPQDRNPGSCDDGDKSTTKGPNLKDRHTTTGENKELMLSTASVPTLHIKKQEGLEDACVKTPQKPNIGVDLVSSNASNKSSTREDSPGMGHTLESILETYPEYSAKPNGGNCHTEVKRIQGEKSWVERNFQQFDPIIRKMEIGFRENYLAAREKGQEHKVMSSEMGEMTLEDECDWMNDDNLRDIVLKVRDNELAGREPFHLMDADEQHVFFEGLERKVERENKKLLVLHELIHSKVENIDYGIDGISLDDPLEKIVPRWKGPPLSEDTEFLNNFAEHQQVVFGIEMGVSQAGSENSAILHKSDQSSDSGTPLSSPTHTVLAFPTGVASVSPKTVIDCSDGSSRAGKKFGKEQWAHTKRWSQEFLELYNAEKDPEIKSIMRDMGKDLDKWITDKEIEEVADLMTRIPKKRRKYIEKKLDKLKREISMFGHQAVVSKYREYSEEKEEDYLWWLDLKYILCIELYRTEENAPKVGFYSLEMAADLEINPKQYHVIAFEDPGDAKNFCHIIQAHLEMLGNGNAFVVARPPKDAFQDAKANGFNVTVIRRGEIKLNIDLTLEEVEEEITEFGSKIYHDKIIHERSISTGALMKGFFNADKPINRQPANSRQLLT